MRPGANGADVERPDPGTASIAHLRENLAAENVTLDDQALRDLDGVGA